MTTLTRPPRRKQPSRIPIRGAIGAGVTAAGLAMLMSVRAPVSAGVDTALLSSTTGGSSTTTSVGLAATTASPTATASSGASASASATAATQPTAAAAQSVTLTGSAVNMRFGTVQVQVTVVNGVITDVNALQLPNGDGHSAQISQIVEPMLANEALTAQSASIDTVSGATYTSRAYKQSLQSALDQLAA